MAKSDADADGNRKINKSLTVLCLCFELLAIFYWRLAWIIAVDLRGIGRMPGADGAEISQNA